MSMVASTAEYWWDLPECLRLQPNHGDIHLTFFLRRLRVNACACLCVYCGTFCMKFCSVCTLFAVFVFADRIERLSDVLLQVCGWNAHARMYWVGVLRQ